MCFSLADNILLSNRLYITFASVISSFWKVSISEINFNHYRMLGEKLHRVFLLLCILVDSVDLIRYQSK